jgi:hypothetical protein
MTTKTQKNTTTSSSTTTSTSKKSTSGIIVANFMNILAFAAVCIGGIAMFLATILRWFGLTATWINSMQAIANAIGWLALCLLSINYIRRRKKLWIWIVWAIAIVMIFTGIIMPLF